MPTDRPLREVVAELRGLLEKATPAPWVITLGSGNIVCTAIFDHGNNESPTDASQPVADFLPEWAIKRYNPPDHRPNMELTAASRNALPRVLEALGTAVEILQYYRPRGKSACPICEKTRQFFREYEGRDDETP